MTRQTQEGPIELCGGNGMIYAVCACGCTYSATAYRKSQDKKNPTPLKHLPSCKANENAQAQGKTLPLSVVSFHVRYRIVEMRNGQRVRKLKAVKLADKDVQYSTITSKALEKKCRETLEEVASRIEAQNVGMDPSVADSDMRIVDFWEKIYMPYCDPDDPSTPAKNKWMGTGMRASTVRGFKQIWNQHLKDHFENVTLRTYTAKMARLFLQSIKTTQGKNTLRHIRALGSAMFTDAVNRPQKISGELRTLIDANPWKGIPIPKDCKESYEENAYTLEEVENIISALNEHPDCQLIMALSGFLGLRPSEIGGLQWDDFDSDCIHIRRGLVRGVIAPPKTKESIRDIPLYDDRVRIPLNLWRNASKQFSTVWVFPGNVDGHLHDFGSLISKKIRPAIDKTNQERAEKQLPKLEWKGIRPGRHTACSEVVKLSPKAAQKLLGHKNLDTTLKIYDEQIAYEELKAVMQQQALSNGKVSAPAVLAPKPLKASGSQSQEGTGI